MVDVNAKPSQVNKPSAAVKPVGDNMDLLPGEYSAEEAKDMLKTNRFFDPTDRAIEGRVQMLAEGAESPKTAPDAQKMADDMQEAIAKRARFDALGNPVVTSGFHNPIKLIPVNPDELAPMETVVPAADSKVVGTHDILHKSETVQVKVPPDTAKTHV